MKWLPIISLIIAISAFGLSCFTLYLQRKDRRPKLTVKAIREPRTVYVGQGEGGGMLQDKRDVICLQVANPTERQIVIDKVKFVRGSEVLDLDPYKKIESLATHTNGEIIIRDDLSDGYFVVVDALGNEFKSSKI